MIASREYVKDLITKIFKSDKYKRNTNKYSTDNEQIIGEWVNGKPIYRRVDTISVTSFPSGSSITLISDASSWKIDKIINFNLLTTGNSGKNQESGTSYHGTIRYINDGSTEKIIYQSFGNYTGLSNVYLITEYTKTTD